MFSMESRKRGRNERMRIICTRVGLTAPLRGFEPLGVVALLLVVPALPLLLPPAATLESSAAFFDIFLPAEGGRTANSCGPGMGGGKNEDPGEGNGCDDDMTSKPRFSGAGWSFVCTEAMKIFLDHLFVVDKSCLLAVLI
eukprot:GHVR01154409.1.p2 GENE.GHVR01154409.1~~GHVR01154409.1.p2  ORF type:complete len:140 (-),score=17.83 GHVR01154409.1:90-509(-)